MPTLLAKKSSDTTSSTASVDNSSDITSSTDSSNTSSFSSSSFNSFSNSGNNSNSDNSYTSSNYGSSSSYTGSNGSQSGGQSLNLTASGDNAATGSQVLIENDNTDWVNKKWRPAMGWVYLLTCVMDFIVFPVLWSILQAISKGQVTNQWQPVTLMGAGLYHVSMGAIIGITAYGRTQEKLANKQ